MKQTILAITIKQTMSSKETKLGNWNTPAPIVVVVGALNLGNQVLPGYLRQQHPGIVTIEIGAFARQLAEDAEKDAPKKYDLSARKLAQYGASHVISQLIQAISQSDSWQNAPLIITGIQTPAEAATLKDFFGPILMLAYVEISQSPKPNAHTTKQVPAERPLPDDAQLRIADWADVILWNDGALEHFYRQIDAKIVPHLTQSS